MKKIDRAIYAVLFLMLSTAAYGLLQTAVQLGLMKLIAVVFGIGLAVGVTVVLTDLYMGVE